ncbi:BLOC-1-related complex subunit 7 isoform X4 [Heterocephalus glaber]|uniref:BLOC-1-related complex subunit 7 isoform X4 n=1 Tax=Heterocephalus glaber TaxID=10181 RepID=A0AAX6RYW9_HETGA|nr:BLOC-1-related complex subunit 7 isoform X4 [Heterocephalus glaber]
MFASPVFPVCGDRRRALCAPPTAPHRSPGPASEQRRPRPPQLHPNRESELLGQAARNMVLQEDAILHSEDARSYSEECRTVIRPTGPTETSLEIDWHRRG